MPKNNASTKKLGDYLYPWTGTYWKTAATQGKDLKVMVTIAMMVALSVVLSSFFVPVGENLRIKFDFIANSVAGMIGGPIVSLAYGLVSDLVAFLIFPSGTFFPGYTLSSILGAFLYALFFYRTRITMVKIAACRLTINLFINVLLGSVWSAVLFSHGYWYYLIKSIVKNAIMLPIEVAIMVLVLGLLVPIMANFNLIPKQPKKVISII